MRVLLDANAYAHMCIYTYINMQIRTYTHMTR